MLEFLRNRTGNVSIMVASAAIVLVGSIGTALDASIFFQQRNAIQAAVDSAALASAYEMGLVSTDEQDIREIAYQYVNSNFAQSQILSAGSPEDIKIDVEVDPDREWVKVDLAYTWEPFFAHVISDKVTPVRASATASLAGDQAICVIALDPSNSRSLYLSGGVSTLAANQCGIYANSTSSSGVEVRSSRSQIRSATTFVSGGFRGDAASFEPSPITDSPPIQDPLAARAYPPIGACRAQNTAQRFVKGQDRNDPRFDDDDDDDERSILTLDPGTYCDGLTVMGAIDVRFRPGIYIFKDGPLTVSGNATVSGDNVGMFFTGDNSVFAFEGSTQVHFTAPEDGEMAGILFFEDRSSPANRDFVISTLDAERFEGTVYLSRGRFIVAGQSRLGQESNWTAIIAHQIEAGNGTELEINSDFANSSIPVPSGLAPEGGRAILTGPRS